MTRKEYDKLVDDTIEEAKGNLTGDDLDKCITALNNWRKNYTYLLSLGGNKHDSK